LLLVYFVDKDLLLSVDNHQHQEWLIRAYSKKSTSKLF
jgi:hypothetical protein